jgi:hypothetical protein
MDFERQNLGGLRVSKSKGCQRNPIQKTLSYHQYFIVFVFDLGGYGSWIHV